MTTHATRPHANRPRTTPDATERLTIAQVLDRVLREPPRFRFEAYDGSATGPADAPVTMRLRSERGLAYLLTAPGDLGFARAYVSGDLDLEGGHPGNPYEPMQIILSSLRFRVLPPHEIVSIVRALGLSALKPPPPPPEEHVPRWRRTLEGLRHSKARDADVVSHHYDVSNRFYELVLGPSMTYTCALYPDADATLEAAQEEKYELVCRKLGLRPGMTLLDFGCGWGGMVRHAARHHGVRAIGVTLSAEQATWAQQAIADAGLDDLAEVRHQDYRDLPPMQVDAISSIGMTEHIGVRQYEEYFRFAFSRLRPGGRMLNHCITRRDNRGRARAGQFIDRYVFPDGELTGSGRVAMAMQDAGFELRHSETLREHYALTLRDWCRNLEEHWDEALDEVSLGRAKVWGLYMAACRIGFERDEIELHHLLGVRTHEDGSSGFALRPAY